MHIPALIVIALAFFVTTGDLLAHGGQFNGPNNGRPTVKPRPKSSPRSGGTTSTLTPSWSHWWERNREEFFDVRARRIAAGDAPEEGTTPGDDNTEAPPIKHVDATRSEIRRLIVPVLARALRDSSSDVRDAAAIALGRAGDVPELAALKKAALDDATVTVREGAILGMGLLETPMAEAVLVEMLESRDLGFKERGLVAIALGLSGGHRARSALEKRLGRRLPVKKAPAVKTRQLEGCRALGLGLLENEDTVPALIAAFKDGQTKDSNFHPMTLTALARRSDPQAARLVFNGLGSRDREIRRSAAILAGRVLSGNDPSHLKNLRRAYESQRDLYARAFLAISIGRLGGPAAVKTLKKYWKSERNSDVQGFVLLGLGITRDAGVVDFLEKVLKTERKVRLRGAAAIALGIIEDPASRPALRKALAKDKNPDLRAHIVTALGMLGDKDSSAKIRKILTSERGPDLLRAAGLSLALLRDEDARLLLIRHLKSSGSIQVKGAMATALGRIGDRRSIEGLIEVLTGKGETNLTRAFAAVALGLIGDKNSRTAFARISIDSNYTLMNAAALNEVLDVF